MCTAAVCSTGVQHRELTECLCTRRALPKPRARTRHRGRRPITPDIMISARPAEINDRAVPGPWEGDLIIGLVHACTDQYQQTAQGNEGAVARMRAPFFDRVTVRKACASIERVMCLYQPVY